MNSDNTLINNGAAAGSAAFRRVGGMSLRVVAAIFGGYAFTATLINCAAVALPLATSMSRSGAVLLMGMLSFIIYLLALLWAFAERRVWLVWIAMFGGAGALHGLTKLLLPLVSRAAEGVK